VEKRDEKAASGICGIMVESRRAQLVLENGAVFSGSSFGYESDSAGEICFNTSMSGYQEILTDPSYCRQIITMTYPMIGNYGCDPEVNESSGIHASGLVVKEYVPFPSNHTSRITLSDFLKEYKVPAVQGIDTRRLVLMIRKEGAMRAGIFMGDYSDRMLEQVRQSPSMTGADLASVVSTKEPYTFGAQNGKYRVAVLDYGVKTNILRLLDSSNFSVKVFPSGTRAEEISGEFDCFFLSNGPGDPEPLSTPIQTVRDIIQSGKPLFGICLGHQLIGLANGRHTYKMKFGHRGANQPVKNFANGRVEITSQNHGFAVADEKASEDVSHINLNDRTIEGFRDLKRNILSVQYHPEACPGPHDSAYLFQEFFNMVDAYYSRHS